MWGHYFCVAVVSPDQRFHCTWPVLVYEEYKKVSTAVKTL